VTDKDLKAPADIASKEYAALSDFVRSRIVRKPVVRVKIWSLTGTVLFSDEPRLIGRNFGLDDELKEASAGQTVSGISNLSAPENVFDRQLAPKLYATYVPLRLASDRLGNPPVAVAEIYQDYAGIQAQINNLFRTVGITMLVGLGVLYLLLLPITLKVANTLSEQNTRLEEEAKRSEELLRKEHQTVAELRKLNRLQGEFVAVASHELRTPLTSIIGYAKTLRQPQFANDAAARDEFLQAIERQGDRLFQLVENLLTSSHLEDHILRLSISTFSFQELARDVVEGLGSKGSRVRLNLATDLPTLLSDRQYVAQIVANLLGNALKFSPNGTPCELGAKWSGGSLTFWVRDHGIGIPASEVDRIFDRFYQVDSSSTRPYGGIGLGLSLVKNLVQTLGGRIDVRSAPKKGSIFLVTLPLVHPSVGERFGHRPDLNGAQSGEHRRRPLAGSSV